MPSPPSLSRRPLTHPAALALITLATAALLLLFLGTGDPVDMMELFNLVPVREAFRDHHWLMPTLNGVPRLEKPPLPVWLPAALVDATGSDSLWILRLPSLLMALLTGTATYALGCNLFKNPNDAPKSERRYALLAALLLPTMLIFNRQARLASYDIYAAAFLTAGAACLVALAEADRPSKMKWLALTLGAGIATGLSIMSKGPVPVATVMLPLGLWLLLFHRRLPVFAGVALAALISVATFFPWLYTIGHLYPDAWPRWKSEFIQFGTGNAADPLAAGTKEQLQKSPFYYLAFLAWVAPLTPLVIAGLCLPFLKSHADPLPADRERRGRWLLWLILVGGLLLLTLPSEKKPRYALQLFPYAALLCAAVWQEFVRLKADRKLEPAAMVLLAAQALCFIAPAVAGVIVVIWTKAGGPLPHGLESTTRALQAMSHWWILPLFALIAAAGVYLWHLQFRRRFLHAMLWLGICAWALGVGGQAAYRLDPSTHTNDSHVSVAYALAAAGDAPIYTLQGGDVRPWLSTLYFSDRWLPQLTLAELIRHANASPQKPLWVMLVIANNNGQNNYVINSDLEAQLKTLESATQRSRNKIAMWDDEGRLTALLRFDPP